MVRFRFMPMTNTQCLGLTRLRVHISNKLRILSVCLNVLDLINLRTDCLFRCFSQFIICIYIYPIATRLSYHICAQPYFSDLSSGVSQKEDITFYFTIEQLHFKSVACVFFSDAGSIAAKDHDQLGLQSRMLICNLHLGPIFHLFYWGLLKSRLAIKSIANAKNMAANQISNEANVVCYSLKQVEGIYVDHTE